MNPGTRLRQIRERLGLTYRDVQRASVKLACNRGQQQFVLHLSRLAEIENHEVVPSLHRLYALAVIYHLSPMEIFRWYDIPLEQFMGDATSIPAPQTHLMSFSGFSEAQKIPRELPKETGFLAPETGGISELGNMLRTSAGRYRYGFIGTSDCRMSPLVRPGSVVIVDVTVRRVEEVEWSTEFDRPIYFVELHEGHRCGWFLQHGNRLMMQTHPLSRCVPEAWRTPDEAEIVGRVTGFVTQLPAPTKARFRESPELPAHSSKTVR
jgi:transcriptional regulator with XRE-family HTH domain